MDYAAFLFGQDHPYITVGIIGTLFIVGMTMWAGVQLWRNSK